LPGLDFRFYASRINKDGIFKWQSASVCTLSGEKYIWNTTNDGRGGVLIVWKDKRSGSWDIYAQRVDSTGNVLWQLNGVLVCSAIYTQDDPVVVSDGAGGAFIVWDDSRGTYVNIYAQSLDSLGNARWQVNGIAVCTADSGQAWPCIIRDGNKGAIISWIDWRTGANDIYAQELDSTGNPYWLLNGITVCSAAGSQSNDYYNRQNHIISDDQGGAITVWHDTRSGVDVDVYAQRIRGDNNGVAGEPIDRGLIYQTHLKIYPNPFKHYAAVSGLPEGIVMKVYDITGRVVNITKDRKIGKNLPTGVYFVTAVGYKPTKIIKLK